MNPVNTGGIQQSDDPEVIRDWLEALSSGKCDAAAFMQAIRERFASDPDSNWEVLSQLDQYFRRGKIPTETFRVVKTALAESALRIVPVPQPHSGIAEVPAAPRPVSAASADAARPDPGRPEPSRTIPVAVDVVSPSADASVEPKPGSVLRRRYRLETPLGEGSSGHVYQAVDEFRLESPGGQRVAVKVLHAAAVKRAELFAQLRSEFQTLQLLSHPNIVRVHEFDRDGAAVFFTMELLVGATLSRVLQARRLAPLPEDQALALIRELGAGIAHGHSQNLVHGDLNPRNIFVTAQGSPRLLGFPGSPPAASGFSSCQVLEGERPDKRDDVFSLACMAYLLLSGEHPLKEKTALEARAARMSIRRPAQTSQRQWHALRAGLRWERDDRPADLKQWLLHLDPGIAGRHLASLSDLLEVPARKKRLSPWAALAALGVIALLAGAYWFVSQRGALPRLNSPVSGRMPEPETAPPAPTAAPELPTPTTASPAAKTKTAASTSPPAPVAATPTATASPAAKAPGEKVPNAQTPAAATTPLEHATAPIASAASSVAPPHASKVELAADAVDVPSGEPMAQISVHRKGNLRGETSFTWWTESGTAKPGTDFSAVVPQVAHIGDGKSSVILSIPLSNAPHTAAKSFYVVIDENEGGAALAGRTLTMVTLQPAG